MIAISLWQPWASLWMIGAKMHETRSWSYPYRDSNPDLLVHAAKRTEQNVLPDLDKICCAFFGETWRHTLPRGALLGEVKITACLKTEDVYNLGTQWTERQRMDFYCGDFTPGRYAWRAAPNPKRFECPIPYVGRQKIFYVPDELIQNVPTKQL